jgi:DNA topoisomerase 2-associated protein PAT1
MVRCLLSVVIRICRLTAVVVACHRHVVFSSLFEALRGNLVSLFPSTRAVSNLPFGADVYLAGAFSSSSLISSNGTSATTSDADDSKRQPRAEIDVEDQPVWQLLAALAVCADMAQQQLLVTEAREKVLENVAAATKGVVSPEVAALKIVRSLVSPLLLSAFQSKLTDFFCLRQANVNLLLQSLGLDASQITLE